MYFDRSSFIFVWWTLSCKVIKPAYEWTLANPRYCFFLSILGLYLMICGMLSNLRHLVSFIAEIVSRKETRMLVDEAREVVSNISQHVASVQEMVEKCHLLNVKMNVALVALFVIIVLLLFWKVNSLETQKNEALLSPKHGNVSIDERTAFFREGTECPIAGDDVTVSDFGQPTNYQPSGWNVGTKRVEATQSYSFDNFKKNPMNMKVGKSWIWKLENHEHESWKTSLFNHHLVFKDWRWAFGALHGV